jgi:hypothetical protein
MISKSIVCPTGLAMSHTCVRITSSALPSKSQVGGGGEEARMHRKGKGAWPRNPSQCCCVGHTGEQRATSNGEGGVHYIYTIYLYPYNL